MLKSDKAYFRAIVVISIAIPLVVAFLLFVPQTGKMGNVDVSFLPKLNAGINSSVSILLIAGFMMIRRKNIKAHKTLMLSAFALSAIFLISYVTYHYQAPSTKFGDINGDQIVSEIEKATVGNIRYFYYVILLSHILLATAIVPLVLITIYRSTSGQIEKHRKIAKWTFPIWLYVSITGVIVYFMIAPYYAT